MNPVISNQSYENNNLNFTLSGVNVSIANAIRRTIISEIPAIVFRTSPQEQNRATIYTNTTRMNNELLKQRLSCIPIYISDTAFPFEDYVLEVKRRNESENIEYVTTKDFCLRNIKTDICLGEKETRAIFPPCQYTCANLCEHKLKNLIKFKLTQI